MVSAVVAAALPPTTANAGVGVEAGAGVVSTTGASGDHTYAATMGVDVTPDTSGHVLVTWVCQAEGLPDAISTSISECEINGAVAPAVTLPGPTATTVNTAVFPVGVKLTACISGFATFPETTLGGQSVYGPGVCAWIDTTAV